MLLRFNRSLKSNIFFYTNEAIPVIGDYLCLHCSIENKNEKR